MCDASIEASPASPSGVHYLNPILLSTMALFGIVGGYIGWRRATKPIYQRLHIEADPGTRTSRRAYERAFRRRRKLWRLVSTLFYAVGGALCGILFLMFLARR
jgi:hypothetical protein